MVDKNNDIKYLIKKDPRWKDAFVPISNEIWDRMKPALQLATLLMRMSRPFPMKVSFGKIHPVSFDSNMWVFKGSYNPKDGVSDDDKQYRRLMCYLYRHRIYFGNTLTVGAWAH